MRILKAIPGIALSVGVAPIACWLESLFPVHLIGSAIIVMFIGMIINHFLKGTEFFGVLNSPQRRY